jgi:defect-in-organelle-trafficking protein DotC
MKRVAIALVAISIFCVFPLRAEDAELTRLKNLKGDTTANAASGALRDKAQKEAAYSASIQLGINTRYAAILETVVGPLEKRLDCIFDFQGLMIRDGDVNVLPPVLTEAGSALRVGENGKSATYQSGSFLMVSKAKIVPTPPNWREYLFIDLVPPEEIHPGLYPVGQKEAALWRERAAEGFALGIEQADLLFKNQVALLTRDFCGLLLYEELRGEKRVSSPEVENNGLASKVSDSELVFGLKNYELVSGGRFEERAVPR